MEFVIYPLATIGAVAVILLGAFAVIGLLSRGDEPRHIAPDLLVEVPPLIPPEPTEYRQRRR
jgi:hypothetical protein